MGSKAFGVVVPLVPLAVKPEAPRSIHGTRVLGSKYAQHIPEPVFPHVSSYHWLPRVLRDEVARAPLLPPQPHQPSGQARRPWSWKKS